MSFELHDGEGKRALARLPGDEALKPHSWQHVCVRYSGGQSNSSFEILVNGRIGRLRNATELLIGGTDVPAGLLRIGSNLATAALSDLRIYRRRLSNDFVHALANDYRLKQLATQHPTWEMMSDEERSAFAAFHRAVVDVQARTILESLNKTQTRYDYIYSRSVTTLVMQERSTPARAWVLRRGEYDQRGDRVEPAVPSVLNFPGSPFSQSSGKRNRLHLAEWLVHRKHPLTSRVIVNRLWQSIFGTGIVKTSEDFGVMGAAPSHPELLDWLSVELMESGWDIKHIMQLMVTSATYQQSHRVSQDKLDVDAANRLLSRGPRLRLDAEVLRDQALAVSGLMVDRVGGPSVKPYQPSGLWNVVAITGSNTRYFKKDQGEAMYRRSVYTFWKRTSPPPSMAAFNAPTREQCMVRRERTNTPMQALVLMNDPQFMEAARHLAETTIRSRRTAAARVEMMFQRCLRRPPSDLDRRELVAEVKQLEQRFRKQMEVAKKLIAIGDSVPNPSVHPAELAAWTIVANTLMNRDDFITN